MDPVLLNDIYQALDPVAFWIGPFAVRWYGLGYILGILLGGLYLIRVCKRWRIRFTMDALLTFFIAAVLGIILGARLGYILFYGVGYYFENPGAIFDVSNGGMSGMSFHGGVIGMVIAVLIASRIFKMPFATLGDLVVIVAPIGIFLVRVANFINGELWGAPTDLPWGVEFESGGGIARHPSQLYEAFLEGLVLFIVMAALAWRRRPLPRGSYIGIFMILYGIFRISVEFIREPDIQLGYLAGGWLTMGMVLCLPMIAAGIAMLIYAAKTRHPQMGLPALVTADAGADVNSGNEAGTTAGSQAGVTPEEDGEDARDNEAAGPAGEDAADSFGEAGMADKQAARGIQGESRAAGPEEKPSMGEPIDKGGQ